MVMLKQNWKILAKKDKSPIRILIFWGGQGRRRWGVDIVAETLMLYFFKL